MLEFCGIWIDDCDDATLLCFFYCLLSWVMYFARQAAGQPIDSFGRRQLSGHLNCTHSAGCVCGLLAADSVQQLSKSGTFMLFANALDIVQVV